MMLAATISGSGPLRWPLVNMNNELVGVNTVIVGPSGGNIGIGFAIPGNMASVIMAHLSEHGEVSVQ